MVAMLAPRFVAVVAFLLALPIVAQSAAPTAYDSVDPLIGTASDGNTFPGVYDSLGRNIFVGLTANF